MAPAQARGGVVPGGALQRCHRHHQAGRRRWSSWSPPAVAIKPELNAAACRTGEPPWCLAGAQAVHKTEGPQLGEMRGRGRTDTEEQSGGAAAVSMARTVKEIVTTGNGGSGVSFLPRSEYGLGNEVSTHGDVYSYGILLLEMFTGKRPTQDEFGEAMGLRKYVQMALPDRVSTIMDQQLQTKAEDGEPTTSNSTLRISCVTSILQVGISCSEELPMDRVSIGDALKELQAIRDKLQKLICNEEASSSH